MPRVRKDRYFYKDDDSKDQFMDVIISVNSEGSFYADLPKQFSPVAEATKTDKAEYLIAPLRVDVFPPKNKPDHVRLWGEAVQDITSWLKSIFKKYSAPEISTARVILYSVGADYNAVRDSEGQFFSNGEVAALKPGELDSRWVSPKGRGTMDSNPPSVVVTAAVFDKITTTRANSEEHKYEWVRSGDIGDKSLENPAYLLNSFVRLGGGSNVASKHRLYSLSKEGELPYTDGNARFFYDLMLATTQVAHMITEFFEQEGDLQDHIHALQHPLLGQRHD